MHRKSSDFGLALNWLPLSTSFCLEVSAVLFSSYRLLILVCNIPAKPMTTSVDMLKSCGFFIVLKKWALT